MKVIHTIDGLGDELGRVERPLGLVPTMGAYHQGHMELVRRARSESTTLVVSIFVNPTQFGPREDYSSYPRDSDADLSELERAKVDLVFAPSVDEMYPEGFDTFVDVGRIADRLEGVARPNHFRGVATVVCKLLAIVHPDRAYFGQKDAQQCLVVRRLNADLDLGADIVVVPTVREADGLALSSRNRYLGPEERRAATVLYRSLRLARDMWERGASDAEEIRRHVRAHIEDEPHAQIDYVSVADAANLEELDVISGPALVSLAVRIGKARLIDNIVLESPSDAAM
jgi:pantoate--beta-alanine ligase